MLWVAGDSFPSWVPDETSESKISTRGEVLNVTYRSGKISDEHNMEGAKYRGRKQSKSQNVCNRPGDNF